MNIRHEIIKLLEENIGKKIFDTSLGNDFLKLFGPKMKVTKAKKKKKKQVGLDQTKKLLHSKENHNKMKRQPTKWEKIFANHILFKIHKEFKY